MSDFGHALGREPRSFINSYLAAYCRMSYYMMAIRDRCWGSIETLLGRTAGRPQYASGWGWTSRSSTAADAEDRDKASRAEGLHARLLLSVHDSCSRSRGRRWTPSAAIARALDTSSPRVDVGEGVSDDWEQLTRHSRGRNKTAPLADSVGPEVGVHATSGRQVITGATIVDAMWETARCATSIRFLDGIGRGCERWRAAQTRLRSLIPKTIHLNDGPAVRP